MYGGISNLDASLLLLLLLLLRGLHDGRLLLLLLLHVVLPPDCVDTGIAQRCGACLYRIVHLGDPPST